MRCCVIDDEPLAAELLASYIDKTPFMENVGTFNSAADAVKAVMSGNIDVVFLDIKMPQLNGLEFARIIPKQTQIIFTTAYDKHAIEAFRIGALDYLLKPVSYEEFTAAALRAAERRKEQQSTAAIAAGGKPVADGYLLVRLNHRLEQINTADITYIEGLKDYVKIHLNGREPVVTLTSMRALEQHLPAGQFMRIHRSYIVNVSRIIIIDRQKVTLIGNHSLPVSDGYRQSVSDYIAAHSPE
jgi:DNA-binding LytR/AlgR family response regulator